MTEYEQQIESGKKIVSQILADLAIDLREPKVNEFAFKKTDQDFDRERFSLICPNLKIVAKIEGDDLADCLADGTVRKKLEAQVRQSVQIFLNN